MSSILVLHGPNLNMLGSREPEKYGSESLDDVNQRLRETASSKTVSIDIFQSNSEHELIDKVHQAKQDDTEIIIINPAAYTHTSIALRDALLAVDIPFFEIHISNVHSREEFRHKSYFSDVAIGVICGLGTQGYDAALTRAIQLIAP